jgi:Tol biopolymer transport system component
MNGKRYAGSVLLALGVALLLSATGAGVWGAQQGPPIFSPEWTVGGQQPAQEPEKKEETKEEKKKPLPLKPERTIEFTTDEATWLSLDVSPDGKTIVFELLGDLYTLGVEGGEAKRLPLSDSSHKDGSTMAFDSQPRFSPDGKWIAFLSDRDGAENVWIAKADGTEPKQLSKSQQDRMMSPAWTPDSQYVVVSRGSPTSNTAELWMYHVKGGSGVQITRAATTPTTPGAQRPNAIGAVVSPDGRHLYYARRLGQFEYNMSGFPWQIIRRDLKTGDEDTITQEQGGAFRPWLSPDGKKLVYGTRFETDTGLRIRDLTTGEDRWLKYPVQRDDQESRATRDLLPNYAFTPDGRAVVLSYGGKIHSVNVETGTARTIPFTAKVSQEAGPLLDFPARVDEGPVRVRLVMGPVESPDGKRVAFSALTQLYVMDLPGGKPTRVTSAEAREFQPAWSPDRQWLAYVTWSVEGGHIWKVRADGRSAPVQLTRTPAYYREPVWSPDGDRIVALRAARRARVQALGDFGGAADLIWIPSDGGEANLIVPARGTGRPHFTDEKDRVYVHSNQGLVSMRFDGTDRRTHVRVVGRSQGAQPASASEVRMGPDRTKALAVVNNQLYVVTVPPVGGAEAPTVNVNTPAVPVKKLTDVGVDSFGWAENGERITWALGSSFFRQPLASVSFEPEPPAARPSAGPGGEAQPAEGEAKEPKKEEKKPLYEEIEVVMERPRHKPQGTIVLRGAKVITMRGDEVIENADVVVTDNRIAAVGPRGKVALPAGARQMDLRGHTLIPGLVDVHAHWFEIRRGVLDLQNWSFLANLAYGVTSGRDPQTATNDMFAYQDLVETGEIIGPRAFSTGPGVFSNTDFQSLDEAKNTVAKYKKYYRTNTLKSYVVGNRKQRQWMIEACKEHGIMPTTEGALDLKLNLTHVLDGFAGNEHSFPIVPLYKDVVELVARSKLTYTPTLLVAYGGPWAENYFYETTEVHDDPKLRRFVPHNLIDARAKRRPWFRPEEHIFSRLAAQAAKIVRAGGRVGLGGHGQLQGIQCHWELWALASGGMTPLEALRVATLYGAEAIGYAQDLGSIEPGKLADLVVLAKDPLVDIRHTNTIRYVMKNGELFEGDTLDQVWPRERKLPPLWWWNDAPTGEVRTAEKP